METRVGVSRGNMDPAVVWQHSAPKEIWNDKGLRK